MAVIVFKFQHTAMLAYLILPLTDQKLQADFTKRSLLIFSARFLELTL